MGIDPMADAAGQQILSPYHAMACNPSTMVDPLGLVPHGEAHGGGSVPMYGNEMAMRFPTMPNFMDRYLNFGERTAAQSMAEQQFALAMLRTKNRITEIIEGGAMAASGNNVGDLYNYLNATYFNGLQIGDQIDGHTYAGLDQYLYRTYLSAPGETDETRQYPSNDLYLNSYLDNINSLTDWNDIFSWDGSVGRALIPDFFNIDVGFSGIFGLGAGSSIEFNWVMHGPEKSFLPVVTVTQAHAGGYAMDATINIGTVRYTGKTSEIRRSMLSTNTFGNGDNPTYWISGAFSGGLNLGGTGTFAKVGPGQYLIGNQLNVGAGLPLGPIPINGAAGLSNTWIIYDFAK